MSWRRMLFGLSGGVVGMNRRNVDFVLPKNPRAAHRIANDKILAKLFLEACGEPYADTLMTFDSFRDTALVAEKLADVEELAIKPSLGRAGRGVLVATRDGDAFVTPSGRRVDMEALRRHVADIVFGVYTYDRPDVAMVEPRLAPSPFFARLYPRGLADIRILAVSGRPVLSMARIPTNASEGRANLHQGALGLGIDLSTGIIERGWWRGAKTARHPDGDVSFIGERIPDWEDIVALATRVAVRAPLRYLGLDIVVDAERGPLVLEFNARPGLEIQNVTGRPLAEALAAAGVGA